MAGSSRLLVCLLVACVLLEVVRGQEGGIGFDLPCGVDNLSCPRIGNLSEIPLRCFRRQELCNGLPFCDGGTDEGLNIVSLECIPGRPDESVFQCGPNNPVPMSALCNGVNDCGLGNDETTALCENKCLAPYFGGCPSNKECITSEFDINCRCLPGSIQDPNNSTECIPVYPCLEDDGEEDSRSSRGRSHSTSPRGRRSRSSSSYSKTLADVPIECKEKSRTKSRTTGRKSSSRRVKGSRFRNSRYWSRILRPLYGLSV